MDNLRGVIKNLFCFISPQQILEEDELFQTISESLFIKLGAGYIRRYSNDELKNMYRFMLYEFEWQNRRLSNEEAQRKESERFLNVFDTLIAFDFSVLIEEDGIPMCQYQHLLRWRDMVTVAEEDLFVTSFLAKSDLLRGKVRKNFFWKPVIGHNNYALNRLVARGVAENHFHLKGSAPVFHLTWISMMNHPGKPEFAQLLREYDSDRLQKNLEYGGGYAAESYVTMWYRASVIRIFLFAMLQGDYLEVHDMYCSVASLCDMCSEKGADKLEDYFRAKGIRPDGRINVSQYESEIMGILEQQDFYSLKAGVGERWVDELLADADKLSEDCGLIQYNIERLRDKYNALEYDYLLGKPFLKKNPDRGVNEVICGERWFMYTMFQHLYSREGKEKHINWFYAYLVSKTHIRMEIVQANMSVGFDNFLQYQNRKEKFIEGTCLEEIYLKMALRDTIYNQSIVSLEARIVPKETPQKMIEAIQKNDRSACAGLEEKEKQKLLSKYFYVVHFIKEPDEPLSDQGHAFECRHFQKREQVMNQTLALISIREWGVEEASRIKGIDASSPEIGCRPEVFAQAFRYLKNHTPAEKYRNLEFPGKGLMATYHVGEDFLDVLDGLRAIDEAIHFLNLRCGDRLGHALALGINVEEWYEGKANRILISKQDYMDNLVWLYAKIRKYNFVDLVDAQGYIEKRFNEYFQEVYASHISAEDCRNIVEGARGDFEKKGIEHGYVNDNISFGISEYYDAWKLRGDCPELYRKGYFKMPPFSASEEELYAVNREYPQNYQIRYNPAVALLYHMYHYNKRVRESGLEMVEIRVHPCIIRAVKQVQYALQKEVANIGLGIETNPSSNYLIGTFRRYDKHPILNWYNNGLTYDVEALKRCPQIQVSINTDDQGVFATYIENEYAYLALALEKHLNDRGERVYDRTLILQWLENIREMGIRQSFIELCGYSDAASLLSDDRKP